VFNKSGQADKTFLTPATFVRTMVKSGTIRFGFGQRGLEVQFKLLVRVEVSMAGEAFVFGTRI
jgi:hypothetical protein